jgi:hypothetical protein
MTHAKFYEGKIMKTLTKTEEVVYDLKQKKLMKIAYKLKSMVLKE